MSTTNRSSNLKPSRLHQAIQGILLASALTVSVAANGDSSQAITLQDATKNISGVQTNFGYGNLYQAFSIRGFETNNILRNGQRASGGVGRNQVEMANVESVEVLKGPAAMLYGRLDPGGMVNFITKKPLDTEYYSLQQQFGSFDLFRTTLDATGPVDKDKTLLYRLDYSYLDADSFQNNAPHASANF